MNNFELESYLSKGVERIVKGILKASLSNPKASIFMMQYVNASKKSRRLRESAEQNGEHIPPFLIASITNQCNLHCKGCYARANHSCNDQEHCSDSQLSKEQWNGIFRQASELGIGFILLTGGEPMMRRDVLETAGKVKEILFPIFTNGIMFDETALNLMSVNRNLIPILSIEGNQETTDARRGDGVYMKLKQTMEALKVRGILFGASVTVTKENVMEVMSEEFTENLYLAGCKAIVYVEYVPVDEKTSILAPDNGTREYMSNRLLELRTQDNPLLFISFPGDEKTSGGCLAAGRGFFHINPHGGAEPCPFSPYSDTNLLHTTLRETLHSPLFTKLRSEGILLEDHTGGCVLFEQEQQVKQLMGGSTK